MSRRAATAIFLAPSQNHTVIVFPSVRLIRMGGVIPQMTYAAVVVFGRKAIPDIREIF